MIKIVLNQSQGVDDGDVRMPEQSPSDSAPQKSINYGIEVKEVSFAEFDRRNQSQVKLPTGYERRNTRLSIN